MDIVYKDALSCAQHWLLSHEYDIESDIQFAPEMAATASEQVFEDYRHSVVNAVACAYLPRKQYTFLFDCASDSSQCDNSRQTFWAVYIGLGCLREHRRLKSDARILVALLPHVDGAEEKSRMYQEAISKVFETMNHAGYHGVRIYLGGARPFRHRPPICAPQWVRACAQVPTARSCPSRCTRCSMLMRPTKWSSGAISL